MCNAFKAGFFLILILFAGGVKTSLLKNKNTNLDLVGV